MVENLPEIGDEFVCDVCDKSFITEWSAAEALAEYEQTFNEVERAGPTGLACDDCWNELKPRWENIEGWPTKGGNA